MSEPSRRKIQAVLFTCAMNAIRSPMAEAIARHYFGKTLYVQSAGIHKGEVDGFVIAVLDEIGIDARKHKPHTLEDLAENEGLNFDLIVTLSPEAHHTAMELTRTLSVEVEYWATIDPSIVEGGRETRLEAYRQVRDTLQEQILGRLGSAIHA